jgi:hypothetical protein
LGFEGGAYAEFVFEDYFAEVVDAAGEFLEPAGCPLQLICCADVEHEIAVQNLDYIIGWDVFCEKLGMLGACTTVATYEDVESFLGGYQTETISVRQSNLKGKRLRTYSLF